MKKHDWKEIQKYYNDGKSFRDLVSKFGVSMTSINNARKRGEFKSRSRSEAAKLAKKLKPQKHSEETKKKISKIRRNFLKENPDKVPYLLNHHSKGMSYPEKYFEKVFRNENIDLVYHFRIGTYQLDFSDPARKIDIEIDGEQHYCDNKIVKSDQRRNKYLEDRGWIVYRVRWSHYVSMDKEIKKLIIKEVRSLISKIEISKEEIERIKEEIKKNNKPNVCTDCNKEITKLAKRCVKCSNKILAKNNEKERPPKEELEKMISEMSWTAIGRKYNVSDNAVRKWAKSYNIIWKKRKKKT